MDISNTNNLHLNSVLFSNNSQSIKCNNDIELSSIKNIDNINYITLETMANIDTYNKYLKKNNLDHDTVLKRDKKFYKKRIIAMTKDILNNNVNNNMDSPIDDVVINAFNNFARLCITHFKFKDTMDNIQGDYKDVGIATGTSTSIIHGQNYNGENYNGENCNNANCNNPNCNEVIDNINTLNEANKLFMKQVDKKVITMDNFVIKTSPPPEDEMIIPKTKDFNLKDPKYKKKDIKKSNRDHMKGKSSHEIMDIKLSKII